MTIHRIDKLDLKESQDYIKKSFTSTDNELDNIISGINTDVSATTSALTTHKTSNDHDSRYYTETELDDMIDKCLLDSETDDEKYQLGYARLLNPMIWLPFKNSLTIKRCPSITTSFNLIGWTTYINRYNEFTILKNDNDNIDSGEKFNSYGLYLSNDYGQNIADALDFTDSSWTASQCTVTHLTGASDTDPAGETTFGIYSVSSTTDYEKHYQSHTLTTDAQDLIDDYTMTASVFAKKNNTNYIYVGIQFEDHLCLGKFDLDTGTAEEYSSNNCNVHIDVLSNGWCRCAVTGLSPDPCNSAKLVIGIPNADGDYEYTGSLSDALYLFGAQLDMGHLFAFFYPVYRDSIGEYTNTGCRPQIIIPQEYLPSNTKDGWTFSCDLYLNEYTRAYRNENTIYYSSGSNDISLTMSKGRLIIDNIDVGWGTGTSEYQRLPNGSTRLVHVRKTDTQQIYLDGHLFWEGSHTQQDWTDDMYIDYTLNGYISNIRIYDFPMTEEEIRIL